MTKERNKDYFTVETEKAIIEYNNATEQIQRDKLYRKTIHPAFLKLVENLIHTFKFYYTEETSIEDLQHEVVTFLVTKLHRFNPSNGAKAYSYFGTVAKRYLIAANQKNYKKRLELLSLDILDVDDDDNDMLSDQGQTSEIVELYTHEVEDTEHLAVFVDRFVNYCDNNLYRLFDKEQDAQIADAILELFRKRDNLTIFNKKALYLYVREIVDAKTPKITKIANDLARLFNIHYSYYLEHGYTHL